MTSQGQDQAKYQEKTGPVIGVFDSGFGGLTVLRALLPLIPSAKYLYLGDTARLPYGSKSPETISRYANTAARFLQAKGAEILVIACNTASALAMDELQATATVPVIGVIEPGAQAAADRAAADRAAANRAAANRAAADRAAADPPSLRSDVLVLATSATVQSHAYARACSALGLRATEKACPLLVPLVEEGWTGHPVTAEVLRIYLAEALQQAAEESLRPATLLLGCTHYPLLRPLIQTTLRELSSSQSVQIGHSIQIIDSAEATARRVADILNAPRASRAKSGSVSAATSMNTGTDRNAGTDMGRGLEVGQGAAAPTCAFFATDSVAKFRTLGARFLGQPIDHVEHVDLGG